MLDVRGSRAEAGDEGEGLKTGWQNNVGCTQTGGIQ